MSPQTASPQPGRNFNKKDWIYLFVILVLLVAVVVLLVERVKKKQTNLTEQKTDTSYNSFKEDTLLIAQPGATVLMMAPPSEINHFKINEGSLQSLLSERKNLLYSWVNIQSDTVPFTKKQEKARDINRDLEINSAKIEVYRYYKNCQDQDHSQAVQLYDGSLGVTKSFCDAHIKPVGRLHWISDFSSFTAMGGQEGIVKGRGWGSGCLISKNLFLTAGHCFDTSQNSSSLPRINNHFLSENEAARLMRVDFNYEIENTSRMLRSDTISYPIDSVVEYKKVGNIDYAILRLGKDRNGRYPGDSFGYLSLLKAKPTDNDVVAIISFPSFGKFADTKNINAGEIDAATSKNYIFYDFISTFGECSGAPIISSTKNGVIGIHLIGGCGVGISDGNRGVSIQSLLPFSPILRSLAK